MKDCSIPIPLVNSNMESIILSWIC